MAFFGAPRGAAQRSLGMMGSMIRSAQAAPCAGRVHASRAFSTESQRAAGRFDQFKARAGAVCTTLRFPQGQQQAPWLHAMALAGSGSAVFAVALCEGESDTDASKAPAPQPSPAKEAGGGFLPAEAEQFLDKAAIVVGGNVQGLLETGVPSQVTAGFAAGFCMGYAAKKSLKIVAFGSGIMLLSLQALAYQGYIKTSWADISDDFTAALDANGDGVIDSEDAKIWWSKASTIVGYNLPAGSGWMGGWVMGLRSG